MEFRERSRRPKQSLIWVLLILCFVVIMMAAVWIDITIARLVAAVFYFLVVGPLMIAASSLVMKFLASAVFGWQIPYSWLLVITGFAFLSLQALGQASRLAYTVTWRSFWPLGLVTSIANILIFSAVVATVVRLASGRPWRQAFLLTLAGVLGLSFLIFTLSRGFGLRPPGFWPIL